MTELDTRRATVIRDARESDLPSVLEIHNANIATSTALWDIEQVDLADRLAWFRDRNTAGMPILVADIDGEITGYASYGQWRSGYGYRYSVENSVYVTDRLSGAASPPCCSPS